MHKSTKPIITIHETPIPRPCATECLIFFFSPTSLTLFPVSHKLHHQGTVMTLDAFLSSVKSAKTKMLAINPLRKTTKRTAIYETSSASTAHPALPQPIEDLILHSWDSYDWHKSSESLTDWINGRWGKTGYSVSKEVVCFTLRLNGRDARLGLQDHLCGAFFRGERRVA
jgi:hypothetical protein